MENNKKYIEYILNPPASYEKGQIWKNPHNGMEFMITDVIDDNVVRAVLLTSSELLADKNDVSLKSDSVARQVFGKERFALRITDGPVPAEQLISYCGSLENSTVKKVFDSLKDDSFSYDETQQILIAELLETLQILRERALELEEEEGDIHIIPIKDYNYSETSDNPIRLAADDHEAEAEEINFWRREREADDKVDIPLNIPNLLCRFSKIDDRYYLILISDKWESIEKFIIKENDEIILELNNIKLSNTHRFRSLIKRKLSEEAIYKIEAILNQTKYSALLMFNYE
jgi:hypothetical protein